MFMVATGISWAALTRLSVRFSPQRHVRARHDPEVHCLCAGREQGAGRAGSRRGGEPSGGDPEPEEPYSVDDSLFNRNYTCRR